MQEKQNKPKLFKYLSLGGILIVIYKLLDNFEGVQLWLNNLLSILMPFIMAGLVTYICKAIEKTFKEQGKMFFVFQVT